MFPLEQLDRTLRLLDLRIELFDALSVRLNLSTLRFYLLDEALFLLETVAESTFL